MSIKPSKVTAVLNCVLCKHEESYSNLILLIKYTNLFVCMDAFKEGCSCFASWKRCGKKKYVRDVQIIRWTIYVNYRKQQPQVGIKSFISEKRIATEFSRDSDQKTKFVSALPAYGLPFCLQPFLKFTVAPFPLEIERNLLKESAFLTGISKFRSELLKYSTTFVFGDVKR